MALEEKRAWIMLVVTVGAYAAYLVTILGRAASAPLVDVDYAQSLLLTIGAAIVVGIVLNIVAGIASPSQKKYQRDREINRVGEYVGQSFLVVGGVAALLLAMLEAPYFWIANAVYLAFVLSSLLGSAAKIVGYRRGFPQW